MTEHEAKSVYLVAENLSAAQSYIKSRLPITDENELHTLLMLHYNTILREVELSYQKVSGSLMEH